MNNHDAGMGVMDSNGIDTSGMIGGQAFDQMIRNNKDMNRRSSFRNSNGFGGNPSLQDQDPGRSSMMEFGAQSTSDLEGFPIRSYTSFVKQRVAKAGQPRSAQNRQSKCSATALQRGLGFEYQLLQHGGHVQSHTQFVALSDAQLVELYGLRHDQ